MLEIKSLKQAKIGVPLKVAAYARISRDKNELEDSLENQISYYTTLISENPIWQFAGIFADDGISGSSTRKRNQFQLMLSKAFAGEIDIIIVKSISRFARNLLDFLKIIQELRDIDVEVYFEKENISTLDPKSDNYLTLYSKFAEEELVSMSRNVKWSVQKRMREGKYYINASQIFGYMFDSKRNVVINEEEAKWVRLAFKMYNEGCTPAEVCYVFEENNVKTVTGLSVWTPQSIRTILRNEKYCGRVILQKSYIDNPISQKRVINRGEKDKYVIENAIPPIVSVSEYEKAMYIMGQHAIQFKIGHKNTMNLHTSYTAFGFCPYCRNPYYRKFNRSNEMLYCSSNKARCLCRESESLFIKHLDEIIPLQIRILKSNEKELKRALLNEFNDDADIELTKRINELDTQLNDLRGKLKEFDSLSSNAYEKLKEAIRTKIKELNDEKLLLENNRLISLNPESRAKEIISELRLCPDSDKIGDYDFRKLIKNVIVIKRDQLIFVLGSDDMSKIPHNVNKIIPIFTGSYKYKLRSTYFTTSFGIYINK